MKYSEVKIFRILSRDGFQCRYCGIPITRSTVSLDHIVPKSKGGSKFSDDNLGASCSQCNKIKGSLSVAEFLDKAATKAREYKARSDYYLSIIQHASKLK